MSPKLDRHDLRILTGLQHDGRITKARLAEVAGLSATPAWARLKRLDQAGLIESWGARVALRKLAPVTEVIVQVTLANHRAADFQVFEDAMRRTPEVVACDATGGGVDYILRLLVRNVDAYQRLMDRLLEDRIGIERYFGYFVTKPVKMAPPDLSLLLDPTED
ncbi:MAG: Lrp/AsnC family transcriptional regulator of ectoine degradation [Paracoccaceae bacterium]|jgi:Lrp/AsnC family transcriptional regulator of ectoine degradation